MTSMRLPQAIPLAIVLASGVWAQSNMAGCPAGFDWNKNSFGQDPCQIASMLDASCRGLAAFTIPPLNSTQYYLPPGADAFDDVMCDCNTVMYSLYMACASCQGGQVYSWVQWISQCDRVNVMQYPVDITQETAVPRWAYYDITSLPGQTWDDTIAMDTGRSFQVMPRQVDSTSTPTDTPAQNCAIPSATTSTRPRPQGYCGEEENPSTESLDPTTTARGPRRTTSTRTPVGSTARSPAIRSTATSSVISSTKDADKSIPITSSVKSSTITSPMGPTTSPNGGRGASSIVRSFIGSTVPLLVLTVLIFL